MVFDSSPWLQTPHYIFIVAFIILYYWQDCCCVYTRIVVGWFWSLSLVSSLLSLIVVLLCPLIIKLFWVCNSTFVLEREHPILAYQHCLPFLVSFASYCEHRFSVVRIYFPCCSWSSTHSDVLPKSIYPQWCFTQELIGLTGPHWYLRGTNRAHHPNYYCIYFSLGLIHPQW